MVLRLLKLMQNIIKQLKKSKLKIIKFKNCKRKMLKLKLNSNINKIYMMQLEVTEICIRKTFLKVKKKLLN